MKSQYFLFTKMFLGRWRWGARFCILLSLLLFPLNKKQPLCFSIGYFKVTRLIPQLCTPLLSGPLGYRMIPLLGRPAAGRFLGGTFNTVATRRMGSPRGSLSRDLEASHAPPVPLRSSQIHVPHNKEPLTRKKKGGKDFFRKDQADTKLWATGQMQTRCWSQLGR